MTLTRHGHNVAVAAFHGLHGTSLTINGITVFPGSGEDPWAQDLLPGHYRAFGADLLITLMDAWVLDPAKLAGQGMNVAHWLPVDCSPLSAMDRRVLEGGAGRPIALSRFGERQLLDAGFDPLYAPHALQMADWKPLENRDEVREGLKFTGKFVVGINAANQDPQRKGLGEMLWAFRSFAARHPDAVMLIHTRGETRQGVNVAATIERLGLSGRAMLGDQYQIASGAVPESQMVVWHGICDVLLNCAWGEGFGLAVLQSQAAGTPVIATDCSTMPELCGAGWLVQGQPFVNRGHCADWTVPFIHDIDRALEEAYQAHADQAAYAALRAKAREFATAYDADKVYEDHWAAILKELCGSTAPAVTPVPEVSEPAGLVPGA